MRRYLHSSVESLERIEHLLGVVGIDGFRITPALVALAERAKFPIAPEDASVNDWLRRLTPTGASAVLGELSHCWTNPEKTACP